MVWIAGCVVGCVVDLFCLRLIDGSIESLIGWWVCGGVAGWVVVPSGCMCSRALLSRVRGCVGGWVGGWVGGGCVGGWVVGA